MRETREGGEGAIALEIFCQESFSRISYKMFQRLQKPTRAYVEATQKWESIKAKSENLHNKSYRNDFITKQ